MNTPALVPPGGRGWHRLTERVAVHLQPPGGWGLANSGLVLGDDASLLVDVPFDRRTTEALLAGLPDLLAGAGPLRWLVLTHANGDHCYGAGLLQGPEVLATDACAAELAALPPAALARLCAQAGQLGDAGRLLTHAFSAFDFTDLPLRLPDRTFHGSLELQVGGQPVELRQVGPAHTTGDLVVLLPEDQVLFTGDLVFAGSHPVIWAGPVHRWVAVLEQLEQQAMGWTVVPGHGPPGDHRLLTTTRRYLEGLLEQSRRLVAAGVPLDQAVDRLDRPGLGSGVSQWLEPERLAANLAACYRDLGQPAPSDALDLLAAMGRLLTAEKPPS
jgi:cyclase